MITARRWRKMDNKKLIESLSIGLSVLEDRLETMTERELETVIQELVITLNKAVQVRF